MSSNRILVVRLALILGFLTYACTAAVPPGHAGGLTSIAPNENELVDGLKEALSVGTREAIKLVSDVDGYFGHEIIKVLMPEELNSVASTLETIGFQKQVDEFVLSMNRAAEAAAPAALDIFGEAVKAMTFEDAADILGGGETAATEYFRDKTSDKIFEAFQPIISASMEEVGATQAYKQISEKYSSLPLVKDVTLDLDAYVTNKALDGLFYMVGEEEKKIRTDPAARVTDLLKKVFK